MKAVWQVGTSNQRVELPLQMSDLYHYISLATLDNLKGIFLPPLEVPISGLT